MGKIFYRMAYELPLPILQYKVAMTYFNLTFNPHKIFIFMFLYKKCIRKICRFRKPGTCDVY